MLKYTLVFFLALVSLTFAQTTSPLKDAKIHLDFKHYYDYAELTQVLHDLASAYPQFTHLESMGKSLKGRDLWVLTVGNPKTGDLAKKPAMYIDGNTHGNEIQGGEVALYTIYYLLTRYGKDDYITKLLDTRMFYIAPSVNPDARDAFIHQPNNPHMPRQNYRPWDEDHDGLVDEDGPEDIDGDGRILSMRVKNPLGNWKKGDDPRDMRPRQPDEPGEYDFYFTEGIDNDGDGLINEDEAGGVDLNRNFPAAWQPRYQQYGAGDYPLSEPETRSTIEWIVTHPNIAAIQSYHNAGNLILRPFGFKDDKGFPSRDLAMYRAMQRRGEAFLPGYKAWQVFLDLYPVSGGFIDWGYEHFGAYTFTNELWESPLDYDKNGEVTEKEMLKWNDEIMHGKAFVDWHPFKHPTLGEIEIGGWDKFHTRMPPTDYLEDLCLRNCLFTLYNAEMMAQLKIKEVQTQPAAGAVKLTVTVTNEGFMDTNTGMADSVKISKPVIVRLEHGPEVEVISGGEKVKHTDRVRLATEGERKVVPERIDLGAVRGRSERLVEWTVVKKSSSKAQIKITVTSEKGGVDERVVSL